MPSEVRIIAFTPEDVLEAIDGFGALADKRLFGGKIVDCHVRKHPGVHAVLEVQRAAGEKTTTVELNSTQLAARPFSWVGRCTIKTGFSGGPGVRLKE